ncbi:MAG TPA: HEAT repeat domain-containing protein [Phycisphaerae bacterium]
MGEKSFVTIGRVAVIGLVAVGALGAAAKSPYPYSRLQFEVAHGKEAVAIRDALLAAAPKSPTGAFTYGTGLATEFAPVLDCQNADARLNAAILFAEMGTLSCDRTLMDMLKNNDPAVRLWGAKGLARLAPMELRAGPGKVKGALTAAAGVEKVPEVAAELAETLKLY